MESVRRIVTYFVNILKNFGSVTLAGMVIITCLDVITRYFGFPVFGAIEIVVYLATLTLACSMPITQVENGHVGVDLFIRKLSPKLQAINDSIITFVSAVLFFLVSWRMFLYGEIIRSTGEVSMSLELPTFIFVHITAVAFLVLALVILFEFFENLGKAIRL